MKTTDNSIIPVILSGGSGTRLWPLSRESYPKQFLALDSRTNQTLLQSTYERLLGLEGLENPILICNENHRFIVAEQFREINIDPQAIILEPVGRNTAPAIAVAALKAISLNKTHVNLNLNLAIILKKLNKVEESIKYFKNVIKLNKDNTDALCGLAQIHEEKNELDKALDQQKETTQLAMDNGEKRVENEREKAKFVKNSNESLTKDLKKLKKVILF